MHKFICFLLIAFVMSSCMDTEELLSAIEYARQGDHQMHHFRSISAQNKNWSISESGNIAILRADQRHTKVSFRSPDRVLIRNAGQLSGQIVKTDSGAIYKAYSDNSPALELLCSKSGNAEIIYQNNTFNYTIQPDQLSNQHYILHVSNSKTLSISKIEQCSNSESCQTTTLDAAFSPLGTLIFNTEELPLDQRTGLAWFVTKNPVCAL